MPDPLSPIQQISSQLERGLAWGQGHLHGAAVLIPLIHQPDGGIDVLFEQRSFDLERQPGEVCFPGGMIEAGEAPRQAALRETCEELLISPQQVGLIGQLERTVGPGDGALWPFVGTLDGYEGSFQTDEVARTFTVPLQWFLDHDPEVYEGKRVAVLPDGLPWELIPGGRSYPWAEVPYRIRFYRGTDPLVWGMTARVLQTFVELLKKGQCVTGDGSV